MLIMGMWLAIENRQEVTLTLFAFEMPELALGLLLSLTLLLGVLLGYITYYLVSKPGSLVKGRALSKAQREINQLRTGIAKD